VLLIVLVGIALRAYLLGRPVGQEEAFAFVEFAVRPFGELISDFAHPSNHILHTLLTKWSTDLFGVGLISLRLPAFIAGVLVMPLFYLFVRGMFNRYIALLTLALIAGSGPLIEYSAIARGYSMTWLCLVLALVLGRHMIKTNSAFSATLIGVVLALGMWTMPSMIYPALMVLFWLFISLTIKYGDTLRQRLVMLLLSLCVFIFLTALLYMPVVRAHGIDQIIHHPTVPYLGWWKFKREHWDMAFELWAYLVDGAATWVAILGLLGFVQAAFVSSKYRALGFALALGAIPLVVILRQVVPPEQWLYTLFFFHLGMGISLFYLLKFIQEKVFPGLGKRVRTMVAALVLLALFAFLGMPAIQDRNEGVPQAKRAVTFAKAQLEPGDKLYSMFPLDGPIEFYLRAGGMDTGFLSGSPSPSGKVLVIVSPENEQTPDDVLQHFGQDTAQWPELEMVQEWPGMRIFAAP